MVPENIHTLIMEGIGNSGGVGGSQRSRKFWRGGREGFSEITCTFPDGQVRCCDDIVQKSLINKSSTVVPVE